jgi:hypothetical protein
VQAQQVVVGVAGDAGEFVVEQDDLQAVSAWGPPMACSTAAAAFRASMIGAAGPSAWLPGDNLLRRYGLYGHCRTS